MAIKTFEVELPTFKKGDDLNWALEQAGGNIKKAFIELAELYECCSTMCRDVADHAADITEADGDCHMITITGEEDKFKDLIENSVISSEFFDEMMTDEICNDECECDNCECEDCDKESDKKPDKKDLN